MARSAVMTGRTIADMVRNFGVVILMIIVGFLVGFEIHGGWARFAGAVVLLLAFGFAMSWVFALVALSVRNAEAAQAASFPILAILVFASNAFVPVESMPRVAADVQQGQSGLDRGQRRARPVPRRPGGRVRGQGDHLHRRDPGDLRAALRQ